jgi:hypothetical protein
MTNKILVFELIFFLSAQAAICFKVAKNWAASKEAHMRACEGKSVRQ